MDETLAAHLAPKLNTSANKSTRLSKHCQFSAVYSWKKIYHTQGLTACMFNRALVLQVYKAEKLQELQETLQTREITTRLVYEVHRMPDFILRFSSPTAIILGKGMA